MYKSSYPSGLKIPELSTRDRVIYLTLIVLSILGAVGATVAFLLLYEKVHFVSAEVIGFANRAGVFGWLATVTLMVLVSAALIAGFNRKLPIFGAPGVTYGGPDYHDVSSEEPAINYHCHCEAAGRGNLLEPGENLNAVPGDRSVASLLTMTAKLAAGPSL